MREIILDQNKNLLEVWKEEHARDHCTSLFIIVIVCFERYQKGKSKEVIPVAPAVVISSVSKGGTQMVLKNRKKVYIILI